MKANRLPWWLLVTGALALVFGLLILLDPLYAKIFQSLSKGIWITLYVSLISFTLASFVGLMIALALLSRRVWLRQVARFYVEIIRGIPILVLVLYIAFVGASGLVWLINQIIEPLGAEAMKVRDIPMIARAILALTIAYSAFLAEVFRAGFQSVDEGQHEAAQALGLSRWVRFRFVILPQALANILPALGNDFVAMVKDSSLVSILGVVDVTQLGKLYAAGSFRYFETYNVVAYIYLLLTISLSLLVQWLEQFLRRRTYSEKSGNARG